MRIAGDTIRPSLLQNRLEDLLIRYSNHFSRRTSNFPSKTSYPNKQAITMSLVKVLYQTVLRRPSRFFVVVAVGSLFFERTVDIGIENIYDNLNRGKQWKDIASKYQ